MNRRTAIQSLAITATVVATDLLAQTKPSLAPAQTAPLFALPPLPYSYDALEPYFDEQTMHLHHDKHHAAYVNNLNAAFASHPEFAAQWGSKSVFELVAKLDSVPESIRATLRNNGGGHANHSLWWQTLGKGGGSTPRGELLADINKRFTSLSQFEDKLTAAALSVFGSGWAWLTRSSDGSLSLETTANQDSPLTAGRQPILALDVWEHSYYLKYQNRRVEYIKAYWKVIDWDAVSARYAALAGKAAQ